MPAVRILTSPGRDPGRTGGDPPVPGCLRWSYGSSARPVHLTRCRARDNRTRSSRAHAPRTHGNRDRPANRSAERSITAARTSRCGRRERDRRGNGVALRRSHRGATRIAARSDHDRPIAAIGADRVRPRSADLVAHIDQPVPVHARRRRDHPGADSQPAGPCRAPCLGHRDRRRDLPRHRARRR